MKDIECSRLNLLNHGIKQISVQLKIKWHAYKIGLYIKSKLQQPNLPFLQNGPSTEIQLCLLQSNHYQSNHYPNQAQVTNFT